MMVFNLLPIYPLDGGRTLRGALSMRMHANKASFRVSTVGFVGNGLLVLLGLLAWVELWDPLHYGPYGFLLAWIGVEGIQACRRLRMQARYDDIYADHDPFQKTLLDSVQAMNELDEERAKKRKKRDAHREKREDLQASVDRLLDRITEVGGVDKLTSRERKELERASKKLANLR